jgi:hypothetical protein
VGKSRKAPIRTQFRFSNKVLEAGEEWSVQAGETDWVFSWVSHGLGYLFEGPKVQELTEGSLLVVRPSCQGEVRASQLGSLELFHFSLAAANLLGILSPAEEAVFNQIPRRLQLYEGTHPAALAFAHLSTMVEEEASSLALRCQMLQILAAAVEKEWDTSKTQKNNGSTSSRYRFRLLVQESTQTELFSRPLSELAMSCSCSIRYFNRLFSEYFKCSYAEKLKQWEKQKSLVNAG